MEPLYMESTENSPQVTLDYDKGLIELAEKSYPENTFEFYNPILQWIETYFASHAQTHTQVNIKLSYFNSGTSQILFDLFDLISEGDYQELTVHWYYDASKKSALRDYEDYAQEFEDLHIQAIACE